MLVSANIEDRQLEKKIADYLGDKEEKIGDLMTEALKEFFQKEKLTLNYQIQNIKENSTIIDFNLEEDTQYKPFKDINNVEEYSKELRKDAWE